MAELPSTVCPPNMTSTADKILSHASGFVFSVVKPPGINHRVEGRWRLCVLLSFVTIFAATLGSVLYYYLNENCSLTTASFPLSLQLQETTIESSNMIDQLFAVSTNHYCAAFALGFTNMHVYDWVRCNLDYNADFGLCDKIVDENTNELASCFTDLSEYVSLIAVDVNYAECTTLATSVMTSITAVTYVLLFWCFLYLAARVIEKYGIKGLFSAKNWNEILDNAKRSLSSVPEPSLAQQTTSDLRLSLLGSQHVNPLQQQTTAEV